MKPESSVLINRIAYLSIARLPSRTANSIHVMRMCQAMAEQGLEVTLYAPAFPVSELEEISASLFDYYGINKNFRIKQYWWPSFKGRSSIYSSLVSLHTLLSGADLVYARDLKSAVFCCKLGKSVVYEAHSPLSPDNQLFKNLLTSKHLKRLVVISEALRKIFIEKSPEIADRIVVAHDAADIEELTSSKSNLEGKRIRVGYVGHLYRGRGIDLIIELAKACPWADFDIVGGMESDIAYWKEFSGSQANINFHGHLPYNLAAEIRQNCDILLAPFARKLEVSGGGTDTSGWMSPMKIFEYMASGKAIICSDLPVLREILEHEITALFCEAEEVASWIAAMQKLRDDPTLIARLGRQAREQQIDHYTWSSRAKAVLSGLEV